jgi:hypothetical protein
MNLLYMVIHPLDPQTRNPHPYVNRGKHSGSNQRTDLVKVESLCEGSEAFFLRITDLY